MSKKAKAHKISAPHIDGSVGELTDKDLESAAGGLVSCVPVPPTTVPVEPIEPRIPTDLRDIYRL